MLRPEVPWPLTTASRSVRFLQVAMFKRTDVHIHAKFVLNSVLEKCSMKYPQEKFQEALCMQSENLRIKNVSFTGLVVQEGAV